MAGKMLKLVAFTLKRFIELLYSKTIFLKRALLTS